MTPHRLLACLLAWAALASCAQTPAAPPAPTESESVRLGRELRELIGPAACRTDTQCRSLAVGAKACGGPAGYLAWSTEGTDATRLAALAARQAQAQRRENEASGMRSNCALVTDPGAACVASRCRLATQSLAR
ncbi:hypothetical protein [Roseateles sp. LYH14W]|uniref:DUF4189 domain-containing protein n=1 Tax=Pelomonas parva TaxID=3299032 RepID=A0ABW7F7B4_9BURK